MKVIGQCLVASALICCMAVAAEEAPPRLSLAIGDYNVLDDDQAVEYRLEWHSQPKWRNMRSLLGVMSSSDSAYYVYSGFVFDFRLSEQLVFSLSSAAGYYEQGHGKDLGHAIEFRTSGEFAWRFVNDARLGVSLYHLSNAGIDKKNPGTEILSLGFTWPI